MKNFNFKLAGKVIKVVNATAEEIGKKYDGDYLGDEKKIRLDEDMEITEHRFETFCHEVCHAWLTISGLSYKISDEDDEDLFCESFASHIAPLLWPYFKEKFIDEE